MTKLKDKIQSGLDESRMLVLGAQILIGFAFSAHFQPAFRDLPPASQYLNLLALTLMLITICLLISSTALHQLTEGGNDSARLHRFTTQIMESVLALFSLGIGADLYVSAETIVGKTPAAILATAMTVVSLLFWYGPYLLVRGNEKNKDTEGNVNIGSESTMPIAVHDKIRHVLTEARVILPGNQALLGFQLAVTLQQGFRELPAALKLVHVVSLSLIAISTILLLAPAPYHRIVERGEETESFYSVASKLTLSSLPPMAAGIAADFFVVVYKISNRYGLSVLAAVLMFCLFCGMWFGYPFYRKHYPGRLVSVTSGAIR
ncbi:MAG TPA: DUF6328 family protein [Candidatus Acidoferrum sp.]|jgi:hypothetical protein|nr:DUF6328 family protein [Candidatus Acidoferrum sp.]